MEQISNLICSLNPHEIIRFRFFILRIFTKYKQFSAHFLIDNYKNEDSIMAIDVSDET